MKQYIRLLPCLALIIAITCSGCSDNKATEEIEITITETTEFLTPTEGTLPVEGEAPEGTMEHPVGDLPMEGEVPEGTMEHPVGDLPVEGEVPEGTMERPVGGMAGGGG